MDLLAGWPPQALVTLAGLMLTNIAALVTLLWRWVKAADSNTTEMHRLGWQEAQEQRKMVDMLRQVLDRGRRRENAYSTGFELLLIALPHELSEDQQQIVARARSVFEAAVLPIRGGPAEG